MKLAIFCGSISDKTVMKSADKILNKFNISYKTYVISAHRLPDVLSETIKNFSLRVIRSRMVTVLEASSASLRFYGGWAKRSFSVLPGPSNARK